MVSKVLETKKTTQNKLIIVRGINSMQKTQLQKNLQTIQQYNHINYQRIPTPRRHLWPCFNIWRFRRPL